MTFTHRDTWILLLALTLLGIPFSPGGARPGFAAAKKANPKEPPVLSYITLYPGSGGACGASKKNADAKNNHDQRRIQATFREGSFTVTKDFAPGESRTVGFCNYGKLRKVSAKYIN
jgi:hypothetical protein